jgi:RHS repeat-associated protein
MKMFLLGGAGLLALAAPLAAQAQTNASAHTSAVRYDAIGRVTGTIAPDADGSAPLNFLATRNSYDPAGRLVKVEHGELTTWQSEQTAPASWSGFTVFRTVDATYDALGRKLRESLSSGTTVHSLTQYSYDSAGRLECTAVRMNSAVFSSLPSSACDPGSAGSFGPDRITKTVYDAAGRVLKTIEALGTAEQADEVTSTYTPNGKLATLTDGEGNRTTYEYDDHDRLVKTRFPVPTKGFQTSSNDDYEQYGYDQNGNRTSFRNRANETLTSSFDALNRMTFKDRPGSEPDVTYAYDLRGLQTSASFTSTGETIANTFDSLGRLTSAVTTKGGVTRTVANQYDANGNRSRLTYPDGFYVDYDLDGLNRVTAIREIGATSGAGVLATYAYDAQGQRASITRGNGATTSYAYDGASRLSQLAHDMAGTSGDLVIDLAYNPASQIVSRTGSNDAYSWTGHGTESLTYASNGLNQMADRSGTPAVYDTKGNMLSDGRDRVFGYSSENLLTSFQQPSAGRPANPFSYDPLERFAQSGPSPSFPDFYQNYLYDPVADVIIAEYEPSGLFQKFVHGPGQDEPLFVLRGTQRDWFHADERGSVIARSKADGSLLRILHYDEYGRPGAKYDSFMYTGAPYVLQGTYLMRNRFYDFLNGGRFLQTDPIGYGDGPNMYTYVGGDPVNMRDPTGTEGACFHGPSQCGMVRLTPEQEQRRQETVSTLGTGALIAASVAPIGRVAIGTLSWAGRALGIGQRVAAPTIEVASAALPQGVSRHIFAQVGVWRTEGGVAAAATRSREVSSGAIQGLKDAGVSKGAVRTWEKFYRGAIETVKSDGTKAINETARYRAEVLRNVLKGW